MEIKTGEHLQAAIEWLSIAQDATGNGGVSLRYSLVYGWAASYPETTGYIIPTFLKYHRIAHRDEHRSRALKMADWELSIQNGDGSFNGGDIDDHLGSHAFDTGQIVFGLIEAFRNTGNDEYIKGAIKAGDWLVRVQDPDGAWRRFAFGGIPHSYYSRVAWALAELSLSVSEKKYELAARKNIAWTLENQRSNGWFDNASFRMGEHKSPITHTIAYTIEGILETGICLNNEVYIAAARRAADAIINKITPLGYLCATYNASWEGMSNYSCLTGNAQVAVILFRLFQITKKQEYSKAAKILISYLKRKQNLQVKDRRIRGAISGSSPIWGRYQRFAYPNWATKFLADALLLEQENEKKDIDNFKNMEE